MLPNPEDTPVVEASRRFAAVVSEAYNVQKQQTICDLTFPTTVLAVRLNRKRLVVVLEDLIYLYEISNMKLLYTIETSPNPQGMLPGYAHL